MRPKQRQIRSWQAVDPRNDPRLLSIQAKYLKHLTLAFLAELETVEANRHLEIERGVSLRDEVRRFEMHLIKYALQQTQGHQGRAADLLGVKTTTLNSKIKLYHLQSKPLSYIAQKDSASHKVSARPTPALAFKSIAEKQGVTP